MSIGSLTQEDPIGLAGGLNLYGFASGDPVTFSDPFGLCPPVDLLNRDTAVVVYDSVGLKTRYLYTLTGAVKSVIDPRTVTRAWAYDAAERPTTMTDDLAVTETRYFGPSGLLDSVRTRAADLVRHRYDAAGRPTATIYPAHANAFPAPDQNQSYTVPGDSVAWSYDAVGRPLTVSHSNSTITFTYNKEGTVRSERQVVRNGGQVVADDTMRYWYDAGGRRAKFYNGTDTVFYTYGANARLW
ncbi:MAG: hypothetical protein ACRD08_05560, partial [Acidimicrobiales bacterium]